MTGHIVLFAGGFIGAWLPTSLAVAAGWRFPAILAVWIGAAVSSLLVAIGTILCAA